MRLSIHGSRTLHDERVRILILEEIERLNPDFIVTAAEPEGVCEMARQLCQEKAIPLMLFFLNFRFLRGAFEHRSKDILRNSDHALFIHDGKSKGTQNEIKLAIKMNVPKMVHVIEQTHYKSSVGFEIDVPWDTEKIDVPESGKIC
jgi:hypothetical protein